MSEELILITPPAVEPISVDEFKAFVRFDPPEEDALIEELITTARESAEKYTRRSFITTGWRLRLDSLNGVRKVQLHRSPVQAVTAVTYTDESGDTQTVPAENYTMQTNGYVVRHLDYTWPAAIRTRPGVISIDFTAGYGAATTDVPAGIRAALKFYVAHLWESRKPGDDADMPEHVESMLSRYRAL